MDLIIMHRLKQDNDVDYSSKVETAGLIYNYSVLILNFIQIILMTVFLIFLLRKHKLQMGQTVLSWQVLIYLYGSIIYSLGITILMPMYLK